MKTDISVIITALNEEKNISATVSDCLKAFGEFGLMGEVVVVNDGSTDKTGELVNDLKRNDGRIVMIRHQHPCGVGASFWDGVDIARGEIAVWFPADNENDPREILGYYHLLSRVDMVLPFIFNTEVRPYTRHVLSFIYRAIINTTFLSSFNYTNGTVLYRRAILQELEYRSSGFFFQTDILIRAAKKGYLFAEVPCRLRMRLGGVSKAISWRSLRQVTKGYLRLCLDYYFLKNRRIKPGFAANSQTAARRGAQK